MEIAQFLAKSSSSVSVTETSVSATSQKKSGSFNEYMNSFLEVANEVKNNRRSESFSKNDFKEQKAFSSLSISIRKDVKSSIKKNGFDVKDVNNSNLFPMTPQEKEAFERIAVMIADGGLDAQTLSELPEDELDEIVDWVLAGAGGIFEPYVEVAKEDGSENNSEEQPQDFGLEGLVSTLHQIEDLYTRIDEDTLTESGTASIGKLIDLDKMDLVEIDKLAQAIIELTQKFSQESGEGGEELTKSGEVNFRELLNNVPADELVSELEGIIKELNLDVEIPDMPEAVLRSLCTEVVNVNNKMIDAAEMNSRLLDGLSNNEELREQILSSVSKEVDSKELIDSINVREEPIVDKEIIDGLAQAVLEDSSPEEIEELEGELKKEASVEITSIDSKETTATEEEVVEENVVVNSESTSQENAQRSDSVETIQKDAQTLTDAEEVKITVKTEVVQETPESQEQSSKEIQKDTAKDSLTGRAFSGDNTESKEGEVSEESSDDNRDSKDSKNSKFEDSIFAKEESGEKSKPNFSENFADADSKVDFKALVSEVPPSRYLADNPQVRYSDMIENMDKLSKLMISSSEKSMKSITMELSPPELGKLTVEVSVKDGQASASIRVETDGAKQMLMNNIEQLKKNLESHGLKLENFEVELNKQEQEDRNQQSQFAQAQEDERNRRSKRRQNGINPLIDGSGESEDAVDVEQVRSKGINSDGSVDIVA